MYTTNLSENSIDASANFYCVRSPKLLGKGILRAIGVGFLCRASCEKAGAAVNGTTLRRIKRNCGLLSALRATNLDFYALADAGSLRRVDGGEALILGLLAGLAALRLVR